MANWFTTGAGSIVSGLIGGVAKGINPYLGAAVEGGLGGFTAYQIAKKEKKAFKKMSKAEQAATRALPRLERTQKLLGLPSSRQVAPPAPASQAFQMRTNPAGAAISAVTSLYAPSGGAGFLPGKILDVAQKIGTVAGAGKEVRAALGHPGYQVGDYRKESPMVLEAPVSRALQLRKGPTAPMPSHNGSNLALMRRLLVGGVTRREAPYFPGSESWAWPQGMSAVRFGPTGSAHYYRKRRRMNVLNPKALTRSMRRVTGFARFARKCIQFTAKVKMKKGCRKRR